ncbi:hypothetical protein Tco_1146336 [Tanacetum coccineum]
MLESNFQGKSLGIRSGFGAWIWIRIFFALVTCQRLIQILIEEELWVLFTVVAYVFAQLFSGSGKSFGGMVHSGLGVAGLLLSGVECFDSGLGYDASKSQTLHLFVSGSAIQLREMNGVISGRDVVIVCSFRVDWWRSDQYGGIRLLSNFRFLLLSSVGLYKEIDPQSVVRNSSSMCAGFGSSRDTCNFPKMSDPVWSSFMHLGSGPARASCAFSSCERLCFFSVYFESEVDEDSMDSLSRCVIIMGKLSLEGFTLSVEEWLGLFDWCAGLCGFLGVARLLQLLGDRELPFHTLNYSPLGTKLEISLILIISTYDE